MNNLAVLWSIPVFLVGFAAFWCLISKVLSLMAWGRLAAEYAAPDQSRPTDGFRLARAKLGMVSYQGVINADATPTGLVLSVLFLFRVGHPPLLVPWAAFEPIKIHKFLWTTCYITAMRVGNGRVGFQFSGRDFLASIGRWVPAA